jgi:uncharacterized heparinase superfamily protein
LHGNNAFDRLLNLKLVERSRRSALQTAQQISAGQYCFLQQTVKFSDKIDWRLTLQPDVDALWRFHLHYHEYLLDLAAADEQCQSTDYTALAWEIVLDWIANNPPSNGQVFADAWHPFCISRRLPVWILLWTADPPPLMDRKKILNSIVSQANFLADHLEIDLGGNHLLENLRALGLAGCFLDLRDADRWLRLVQKILSRELAEQITSHGEHFERSPMYHSYMLEVVLDLRDASTTVDPIITTSSDNVATRMGNFLSHVLHPDQDIPLLSDSSLGSSPPPALLLERLDAPSHTVAGNETSNPKPSNQIGGYWTFRADQDLLLFDAGPACPDHLPAHAHADLLNLEASVAGQRLFVDTGVYGYAAGHMRQHCRGTSAHNTLQIDNTDQFDMWSRFRVGYRGWPSELETGQAGEFHWARATHNAYRRLGVPRTGRWLACRAGGPWLCMDWAEGQGTHTLASRLHLHPAVTVTQQASGRFRLKVNDLAFALQILGGAQATIESGWYCPEFGKKEANSVLTLHASMPETTALGWALCWPGQEGKAELQRDETGKSALSWLGSGSPAQILTPWPQ